MPAECPFGNAILELGLRLVVRGTGGHNASSHDLQ
jgi:hypothetical protein